MIKAIKETEKAVMVRMVLDFYNIEKTFDRNVWIPKSQLRDGKPTDWILEAKKEDALLDFPMVNGGCFAYFYDADGKEIKSADDAKREAAFKKGAENYQRLIDLAKDNGVKGVRVGLRRATIEAKLCAAGVAF